MPSEKIQNPIEPANKFKVGSRIFYKGNECEIREKHSPGRGETTYGLRIVGESETNPLIKLTQKQIEAEVSFSKETQHMFCPFCGEKQSIEAQFCAFCGMPIPDTESTNELVDSPDAGELIDKALKHIAKINLKEQNTEESQKLTDEEFEEIISKDSEKWDTNIKLDLEALLPPSFNALNEEQKIKVLQDSKRRIVDIVKSDAQTQYSEDLKERMQENIGGKWKHQGKIMTGIRNLKTSIKSSFTKERDLKNTENEIYLKLINSAEGKKLIAEDLKLIVDNVSKQSVYMGRKGFLGSKEVPMVSYAKLYDSYTEEDIKEVTNFNLAANNFAQMPYEWGQEQRKKYWGNRKKYDDAKAEYDKARSKLLEIEKNLVGAEKALAEILEKDNLVRMEQLLNTHPEFDQALNGFANSAGWKEKFKTLASTANTLSGKNIMGRATLVGGFAIRTSAKVLPWLAGAGAGVSTLSTAIAAPITGGVIGYWRGKFRAKETLEEKQKGARYGQKDESAEKILTSDAMRLSERLQDLINEIELASPDKKPKKIANLAVRIEHTMGKVEKGLVNFGDAKTSLTNQFNLVNTLNNAVAIREINSPELNAEIKSTIDNMLKTIGEGIAIRTSNAQNKFIKKQAWKGAALGAGLASAGYAVRWLSENINWSSAPTVSKGGVLEENKISDQKSSSTPSPTQTPASTRDPFMKPTPGGKDRDPFVKPKYTGTPSSTPNPTETPAQSPNPTKTPLEKVADTAEKPKSVEGLINQGIKIERGGAIKAIKDLQEQLKIEHPDLTKAPQSIQDFVKADPTKKAIELGFYDPTEKAESALVQKGSFLKFSPEGKLLFGTPDKDGNIAELGEKYTGKMLDSDKPKIVEERQKVRRVPRNVDKTEYIKIPKKTDAVNTSISKPTDDITLKKNNTETNPDPSKVVIDNPATNEETIKKSQVEDKQIDKVEKPNETEKPKSETVTEKKEPTPTPKTSPTPAEQKAKIETQMDLTEKYPELKGSPFIKNPPLGVSGEKIVEINKLYNENIANLSDNNAENWSYVKDAPTKNFLGQKIVEGDKVVPYLNKLKEISGLIPEYNVIDGDESIEKYMIRVHEWAVKNNKLSEIKNIKIE